MRRKDIKRILIATVCIVALTATTVFAAIDEVEPNDSKQEAQLIKIGDTVYGESSGGWSSGGEDWYKFTAPLSGTGKIYFKVDSGEQDYAYASVDNSENREIAYVYDDLNTDSGKSVTFGVTSGKTYYVSVYNDSYNNTSYHFYLSYSIGKTTISKITGKHNAFNVKWTKKEKASFYQVRYTKKSVYQDYAWNKAKVVKVAKKYGNKTIKKLSKKKKYYVQVRVARTIKGKTYYSGWSTKKLVTTK